MRDKNFNVYSVIWSILFVLFNIIAIFFGGVDNFYKITSSFMIGYVFINISLILQYSCIYYVFKKSDNLKKMFYNFSLINYSYVGLIVSFIVGILCMLNIIITYWIAIIICMIVLLFCAIKIFKAVIVVDEVSLIDDKIKKNTMFIRTFASDVEILMNRVKNDEIKDMCKKLYEAVRYSDPMYSDSVIDIENNIKVKFNEFKDIVDIENVDEIKDVLLELMNMLDERNKKCKLDK